MSMVLIQRQVLSSSAASVTFSNIPQNFKTLRLVVSARGSVNDTASLFCRPNAQTTNLSSRFLQGNGSTTGSGTTTTARVGSVAGTNVTSSTFGSVEILIPNYAGSSNKPISSDSVTENNGTAAVHDLTSVLWANTSAITSLELAMSDSSSFVSNSSFSLYGLI